MKRSVKKLLVKELSNGSVIAFNELYKHYCDLLFRFSFSLLKDKTEAEGVVQHVFIKVWEKRSTLNPELSFQGYIFKITKNYILKLIYNSLYEKEQIAAPVTFDRIHAENPGSYITYSELKSKFRKDIRELPSQRKKVFIMSRRLNMSNMEIAENLSISVNTVKRHMNLAMKTLKKAEYT
jgi:RNA polymerase sigma-70 factor (ECF subfamily)